MVRISFMLRAGFLFVCMSATFFHYFSPISKRCTVMSDFLLLLSISQNVEIVGYIVVDFTFKLQLERLYVGWIIVDKDWSYRHDSFPPPLHISMPDLPDLSLTPSPFPFPVVLCTNMNAPCCRLAGIVLCGSLQATLFPVCRARALCKNWIFFFSHRADH